MKTLIAFLTESNDNIRKKIEQVKQNEGIHADMNGKCGWFKTAESCINFLMRDTIGMAIKIKYFTKYEISDDNIIFIINKLYSKAQSINGNILYWNTVPFIFKAKSKELFINKIYDNLLIEFKKLINKFKKSPKIYNPASLKKTHGGFGGAKSGTGLKYEDTIVDELIKLITVAIQINGGKDISEEEFKNSFEKEEGADWKTISHLYPIYKSGDLDSIINRYIKNPEMDLTKYVIKTGQGKPDRNNTGQLFDKTTFKLNNLSIKKNLIESGKIIADVTILGETEKDNVYISVKLNTAQLSGANFEGGFNAFVSSNIINKTPWDQIKNNDKAIGFINFFTSFGLDPEIIYNQYVNHSFEDIMDIKPHNSKKIAIFAQKLLGGNYWYTKPNEVIFVPNSVNKNLNLKIEKYHNSSTGKTLTISGKINDLKMELVYRTDGNGDFPHRVFIRINVPEFIKKLQNN